MGLLSSPARRGAALCALVAAAVAAAGRGAAPAAAPKALALLAAAIYVGATFWSAVAIVSSGGDAGCRKPLKPRPPSLVSFTGPRSSPA